MICQEAQENFILYLYQELDKKTEKLILEHLEECQDCKKALADMAMVGNMISLSEPDVWKEKKDIKIFPWKTLLYAAALLVSFTLGWSASVWLPYHSPSQKEKILHILAQNQRHRPSLSEEQGKMIRTMEKTMAGSSGLLAQMEYVHKIEESMSQANWQDVLKQKKEFLLLYPESPLRFPLYANLAYSLTKS